MKHLKVRNVKILFCLLLTNLLYGCGSDGDSSAGPSGGTNYLTGIWFQSCSDNGGNTFKTSILVFENTSIIKLSNFIYGDNTCAVDLLSSEELVGSYALGSDVTTSTGETAKQIDITMSSVDGATIPVQDLKTVYTIIYVNGNDLMGGNDEIDPNLDGSTPAKRTNILQTTPYVFTTGIPDNKSNYVVGTWKDSCLDNNGDGIYIMETSQFGTTTITITHMEYSDSSCVNMNSTQVLSGVYSLGNSLTTTSGLNALEIDITITQVDGVALPSSVTLYSIAYKDGNNLYNGDIYATPGLDGTTPATRPNTLDLANPNVKQ